MDVEFTPDCADADPLPMVVRPLSESLDRWRELAESAGNATLFHTPAWSTVLSRAYGLNVFAVTLNHRNNPIAGCLLARTRNPFLRRVVGLPYSDTCAPLGVDDHAVRELLRRLAAQPQLGARLEIRGIKARSPWETVNCFAQWSIDLARPFDQIQRTADRNFIRQVKRAVAGKRGALKIEMGDSPAMIARFYSLHLGTRQRLGVPPQPLRFFSLVREVFANDKDLEVWLASCGGRDQAAVLILRDGSRLYAKWSARAKQCVDGASHLLFSSILEHHADKASVLDLGRTDVRNAGLNRFKAEMGATSAPLCYSYLPHAPQHASAEDPARTDRAFTRIWRRLPLPVTRTVGAIAYRYFA